jgi:thiamine kinase-like enzyme
MTTHASGDSTPATIAASALGVDADAICSVERIKHGLTNDSWRVRTASDVVIVRLSNPSEALLQIDRASEARVLKAVAGAGLGPEILVCDPARRVLVTRDLGKTWEQGDAHVPSNLRRIAKLLRSLHVMAIPPQVRRVDLVQTIQGYLRALDERGHRSELNNESIRLRAQHAALALRHNSEEALCHNDVHHLNIIDDGTLRLIDWEYSGVGEAMFDLASICVYHRFAHHEREHLLEAYLQAPTAAAPHRLELACWLFEYVKELWMEVRADAR